MITRLVLVIALITFGYLIQSCQGFGGGTGASAVPGNENGTQPVNQKESVEYQRAIVKCYKTGGTRIVKIQGELRCY